MYHHNKWLICFLLITIVILSGCQNANIHISDTTPTVTASVTTTRYLSDAVYTHKYDWLYPGIRIRDIKWAPHSNNFIIVTMNDLSYYSLQDHRLVWNAKPLAIDALGSAVDFISDGKSLVLYVPGYGLQKYDVGTGSLLAEKSKSNNLADCWPIDAQKTILNQDNTLLYISTENPEKPPIKPQIQIWDITTYNCINVLSETEGHTRSLDLSPNGRYLVHASGLNTTVKEDGIHQNGRITVWDLETEKPSCVINDHGAYAHFKPNSSLIAVPDPDKNRIVYWNIISCNIDSILEGITTQYDFAFNPDGKYIATWIKGVWIIDSSDGSIIQKLDDTESEWVSPIIRLLGFISFSYDGQYLFYSVRQGVSNNLISLWILNR
jgi:WD40 repeat protein